MMKKFAIVIKQTAPLYEKAKKSTCIDEVLYGMPVKIIHAKNNYFYVETHYFYKGYIKKSAVALCEKQNGHSDLYLNYYALQNEGALQKYYVKAPFADVLSKPNIKSVRLQTVPRGGALLAHLPCEGSWQKVVLVNGEEGFVKSSYLAKMPKQIHSTEKLSAAEKKQLRKKICKTALLYIGAQYRWGGKTPTGIDCSGLVSMAYMLNGATIYRDSAIKSGLSVRQITFSKAKKGDLLYFHGHVALYLGNNNFVHATAFNGTEGVVPGSFVNGRKGYRQDLREDLLFAGTMF